MLVATLVGAHNASRFVDALVGGAIGLAVLVAVPVNPLRQAQAAGSVVFAELAATLDDIAAALEARDIAAVREALARARATERLVTRLARGARRRAGDGAALAALLARPQPARRVRARGRADRAGGPQHACARPGGNAGGRARSEPARRVPAAVRRLAEAVPLVEPALENRTAPQAIEPAVEAAALATRALERRTRR